MARLFLHSPTTAGDEAQNWRTLRAPYYAQPLNCPYFYETTDSAATAHGPPHAKMKSEPDIANKRKTDSEAIATLAGIAVAAKKRSCRYREGRGNLAIIAYRSLSTQKRPIAALPRNGAMGQKLP